MQSETDVDQNEFRQQPVAVLHGLLKMTNRLMAPFSTYLANRYKISLNEFRLLMAIGRLGESASHELAEHTGVNVMSVSRAVAALERNGRITVEPDPRNRRRKSLRLTEEGQRLFELMKPQTEKVADYLVSGLSEDDVQSLHRIMDTVIDTLEARDEEGNSLFLERTKPDNDAGT
ncbi:MarR family transcriptional regulator [Altericroceibacterium spongiae]|uniref:MarR family transcriptional regulator n=1 Tax=Altericroceibacterium spongiae TaxID=2320269 RepID=A0A420EJ04_9SPHN|nr:MarR family transcriptional regulator [Altericroceibacterium spongiae]RKF20648.1 MarR family transcriptional regulator [Altericroceibacterium spongiae]